MLPVKVCEHLISFYCSSECGRNTPTKHAALRGPSVLAFAGHKACCFVSSIIRALMPSHHAVILTTLASALSVASMRAYLRMLTTNPLRDGHSLLRTATANVSSPVDNETHVYLIRRGSDTVIFGVGYSIHEIGPKTFAYITHPPRSAILPQQIDGL
ncbi:hypothetical protein DAEQUDRAFT_592399 [Daedalea quercina L-15889]|uniref:Uncharacterized protein n=1 Tax=Daedalea quercina L-15889 TaxID=1314783 RepID=A0A165SWT5_9APHY|nr:hypothetical protein DAEQUDRAFT_592399 [Daedalea quercina L-15889]